MSVNRAVVVAVIGATGSRKSIWIKSLLAARNPARLLVWSPYEKTDRYRRFGTLIEKNPSRLVELATKARHAGEFQIVYWPDRSDPRRLVRQFELFCGVAIALGRCVVVAEELSLVTKAGSSPPRWQEVITGGRHEGLEVVGTSQRPALVDKTFFANATVIRCGRLNARGDKEVMADALDVPIEQVRALQDGQFIVREHGGAAHVETVDLPKRRQRPEGRTDES